MSTPLLQIAMDYTSLPKALAMATLVAPEVDILAIGTPLCKAAGLDAIRAMRELCPDKLILADSTTPDVGGLEATMACDAQSACREWAEEDKYIIRKLIDMGYKVTITGGMTLDLLPFLADLPVSVL